MKKITLATSTPCGPCHMLKQKLLSNKLEVDIRDFTNPEDIEFFRKHNIKAVPRLVVEDGETVEIIQGVSEIIDYLVANKS